MVFFSPELDGAMFGFGVMCYSNSVRRLRIMRRKFLQPHRRRAAGKESAACMCSCSIAGPWEHAGMMAAGAALGAGLSALNATEKAKMEERLMVQRLRNQSILPRAFASPLPRLRRCRWPCPAHVPRPQRGRSPRWRPPGLASRLNRTAGCVCARVRVHVQLRPAALAPTMRAAAMTTEYVSRCPEPKAQCCVSHNQTELTFRPLVFVSLVRKTSGPECWGKPRY